MSACNALVLECSAPVSACNALLPVCNALVSVCNAPALECNALGSIWDALVPASDACALLCNAPVPARDAPLCKAHLVCNALVLSCVTLLAWRQMCSSLVQMCNAPVLENRCSTHAGSAQRRRATMCNAPKLVCDCSSTGVQCSVLLCNAQCCCAMLGDTAMLGAAVQCLVQVQQCPVQGLCHLPAPPWGIEALEAMGVGRVGGVRGGSAVPSLSSFPPSYLQLKKKNKKQKHPKIP